ncbi:hypothetical protein QYE80_27250 [Pseudomonas tohonis]|nr:hypothetical protein L682_11005 [Pseudomonas alcaligenes OT 69]MDN4148701.1 hypothetical protein [Pseudomonas tohonis]
MNPIQQAHGALIDRLSRILPVNGYLTDAGTRIKEGWLADLLEQDDVAFPFIAVQPGEYRPPTPGGGAVNADIGRRVVGAVRTDHPDRWLEELDALYVDLVRALQVTPGVPNPWGRPGPFKVEIGTAKPFPPGEGVAAGTVLIPIQMHVIIKGA